MRYATVVLTWGDTRLHPVAELFGASDAVEIEGIRYVSPVHEGRHAELLEIRGDLDVARELLGASPAVVEFDVAGEGERGVAYVQCRIAGLVEELLEILQKHDIVLDWPMKRTSVTSVGDTPGLELTVVGTDRAIRRAAGDLPADVRLRLERMGEYEPDTDRFSMLLTDRQLEVLDVAVKRGYYETPRRTTHRELAAELGVSTGTVSEHLQRIEAKLIGSYARRDGPVGQ